MSQKKLKIRIEKPYNPLEKKNLGVSVADALLTRSIHPLPPKEPFLGAGIYAIYYVGKFTHYNRWRELNSRGKFTCPIYVGKAIPPGARKGGFGLETAPGPAIYNRLNEHAKSVKQTTNLDIDDFFSRYLVVDDIWIPLGESLLIDMFHPLWNVTIEGFGNHDPGKGRYNQKCSSWDTLHPGRPWAAKLQPFDKANLEIAKMVKSHISQYLG